MLVLSRRVGEIINIGNDIELEVIEVHGDRVRLGIRAPREISVHRKEVFDAIAKQASAADQSDHV